MSAARSSTRGASSPDTDKVPGTASGGTSTGAPESAADGWGVTSEAAESPSGAQAAAHKSTRYGGEVKVELVGLVGCPHPTGFRSGYATPNSSGTVPSALRGASQRRIQLTLGAPPEGIHPRDAR